MLGTRTLRDRSASRDSDSTRPKKEDAVVKQEGKEKMPANTFVEPPLAQQPSYRDHNGVSYYGVSEHMQPLGEAPSARVKTRVKADGARKSVIGRSAAAAGLDAQETPEGTPAPNGSTPGPGGQSPQPHIVVDDADDADYAPKANGKRKERSVRPRVAKRRSEPPTDTGPKIQPPKPKSFDAKKTAAIVEEAKYKAITAGKPDLAAAVNEIYLQSLQNGVLMALLQAILHQRASPEETAQFQDHVKAAKRKLKEQAKDAALREQPPSSNGTQSLPVRSPSKLTPRELETSSALPTTEISDNTARPKTTITIKAPAMKSSARRSAQSGTMSTSPAKVRSGSPAGSDSSLTDLTSNPEEDMEVDEVEEQKVAGSTKAAVPPGGKDHAAERGSLAAPNRNLKRSSADADLQDDERDRVLAAKKQKLAQTVNRNDSFEESHEREPADSRAARLRARQTGRASLLAPPALSLNTTGSRGGSRAVSTDLDSPLSTPLTASSRQSTPHVYRGLPKPAPGKKAKTKTSPEKKQLTGPGGMPGASGAGLDSPIGEDDNEELSENNDFCSACGGSGFLLCCDGCDRSFHFSCLDPPLNEDASELNEPWFCYICVAKRPLATDSPEKPQRGLFAPLISNLRKRNPSNFALPQEIRDYFEGVATDRNGSFIEAVHTRTRNRPGYGDELPDFTKVKDAKGKTILCYSCGKSSGGNRMIISCDFCGEHWHLDCLEPPRSNPPARNQDGQKIHDWMCPLHADHELRQVETTLLSNAGRKIHIRKPRNPKVVETSLRRGFFNNGIVDVVNDDDSDGDESEFYDEDTQDEGVVYKLPASGIKLDFIDKVKSTRIQAIRNNHAYAQATLIANYAPAQLSQANFARRSFQDKKMALNLAQFANANQDLDLGSDQVETLVGTLIAEAPPEVVEEMMAAEDAEKARSAASAIPPSPPSSEQTEALTAEQRRELVVLQELIRRRLEGGKS